MMRVKAKFRPGDEVFVLATESQRHGEGLIIEPYVISPAGPRVYRAKVHSVVVDGEGSVGYLFKHGFVSHGDTSTQVQLYDLTLDETMVFASEAQAIRRLLTLATDQLTEFKRKINDGRGRADWL